MQGVEQAAGRHDPARLGVLGRREHEHGIRREAMGFKRLLVGGEAVTDVLLGEIADKPDPGVAMPDEVLDRGEGPPVVVRQSDRRTEVGNLGTGEHHPLSGVAKPLQIGRAHSRSDRNDPVHL